MTDKTALWVMLITTAILMILTIVMASLHDCHDYKIRQTRVQVIMYRHDTENEDTFISIQPKENSRQKSSYNPSGDIARRLLLKLP